MRKYPVYKIKKAINLFESSDSSGIKMAITNLTITKKAYIVDLDVLFPDGERQILQQNIYKKKFVHHLIEKYERNNI